MKKIDYHCHFSGALSPKYLYKKGLIIDQFQPVFSDNNWMNNFDLFFKTYKNIQDVTKSSVPDVQRSLYYDGSLDICNSYIAEGVDEFQLRVGPRIDIKETDLRLRNTVEGFIEAERNNGKNQVGKLILTLIHDQTGKFFNVNRQSLKVLLAYLEENIDVANRVLGFDFSGPEDNFDQDELFNLVEIINQYNESKKFRRYEIAVHGGEYVDKKNIMHQYKYLERLLNSGIDRLSHGTIIWLNPKLISIIDVEKITETQNNLKKILAIRGVHLEICPTANRYLSPLGSQKDIPYSELEDMGIRCSINTDNKTIFNTNLDKELGYLKK